MPLGGGRGGGGGGGIRSTTRANIDRGACINPNININAYISTPNINQGEDGAEAGSGISYTADPRPLGCLRRIIKRAWHGISQRYSLAPLHSHSYAHTTPSWPEMPDGVAMGIHKAAEASTKDVSAKVLASRQLSVPPIDMPRMDMSAACAMAEWGAPHTQRTITNMHNILLSPPPPPQAAGAHMGPGGHGARPTNAGLLSVEQVRELATRGIISNVTCTQCTHPSQLPPLASAIPYTGLFLVDKDPQARLIVNGGWWDEEPPGFRMPGIDIITHTLINNRYVATRDYRAFFHQIPTVWDLTVWWHDAATNLICTASYHTLPMGVPPAPAIAQGVTSHVGGATHDLINHDNDGDRLGYVDGLLMAAPTKSMTTQQEVKHDQRAAHCRLTLADEKSTHAASGAEWCGIELDYGEGRWRLPPKWAEPASRLVKWCGKRGKSVHAGMVAEVVGCVGRVLYALRLPRGDFPEVHRLAAGLGHCISSHPSTWSHLRIDMWSSLSIEFEMVSIIMHDWRYMPRSIPPIIRNHIMAYADATPHCIATAIYRYDPPTRGMALVHSEARAQEGSQAANEADSVTLTLVAAEPMRCDDAHLHLIGDNMAAQLALRKGHGGGGIRIPTGRSLQVLRPWMPHHMSIYHTHSNTNLGDAPSRGLATATWAPYDPTHFLDLGPPAWIAPSYPSPRNDWRTATDTWAEIGDWVKGNKGMAWPPTIDLFNDRDEVGGTRITALRGNALHALHSCCTQGHATSALHDHCTGGTLFANPPWLLCKATAKAFAHFRTTHHTHPLVIVYPAWANIHDMCIAHHTLTHSSFIHPILQRSMHPPPYKVYVGIMAGHGEA